MLNYCKVENMNKQQRKKLMLYFFFFFNRSNYTLGSLEGQNGNEFKHLKKINQILLIGLFSQLLGEKKRNERD